MRGHEELLEPDVVGAAAAQAQRVPGVENLDFVPLDEEVQVALVLAGPALLVGGDEAPVAGVHAGDEGPAAAHPVAAVHPLIAAEALDQDAGEEGLGIVAPDLVLRLPGPLGDHVGVDDVLNHRPAGRAAGGADLADGMDRIPQRPAGAAVGRRLQDARDARLPDHLANLRQDDAVLAGLVTPRAKGGQEGVEIGAHGSLSVLRDDGAGGSPTGRRPRRHHGDGRRWGQGRGMLGLRTDGIARASRKLPLDQAPFNLAIMQLRRRRRDHRDGDKASKTSLRCRNSAGLMA